MFTLKREINRKRKIDWIWKKGGGKKLSCSQVPMAPLSIIYIFWKYLFERLLREKKYHRYKSFFICHTVYFGCSLMIYLRATRTVGFNGLCENKLITVLFIFYNCPVIFKYFSCMPLDIFFARIFLLSFCIYS